MEREIISLVRSISEALDGFEGGGGAEKSADIPSSTTGTATIEPNTLYTLYERRDDITFEFVPAEEGKTEEYHFIIEIPLNAAPTITWPQDYTINWVGGEGPLFEDNKTYEVSILQGIGTFVEVDPLPLS